MTLRFYKNFQCLNEQEQTSGHFLKTVVTYYVTTQSTTGISNHNRMLLDLKYKIILFTWGGICPRHNGFAHYYNFCPCLLLCCAYCPPTFAQQKLWEEHKRQKAKVVIQNNRRFYDKKASFLADFGYECQKIKSGD